MKLPEFCGVDIGNHSIKVAQIEHKGEGKAKLTRIAELEIVNVAIEMETPTGQQALAEKINEAIKKAGISTKKCVAAIPERLIFSQLVDLPDLPDNELEETVYYEAKQYLPTSVTDVQLDYIPIAKMNIEGRPIVRSLLVAAPKKKAQNYLDTFTAAGLELIALETETIATARTVTFAGSYDEGTLVLDFGGSGTDLSVVKGKKLIFAQSLGTGSDALTKAIATDFNLDMIQAEQYKRTYGLLPDQADGKIARTLSPVMQLIVTEINKTINFFRAHLHETSPKQIFVVGDGAKLPGLANYLTQNLGITATLIDPVAALEVDKAARDNMGTVATAGFTVAVGLALKQE